MKNSGQVIFELQEKITFSKEIRHKYNSSISRKFMRRKNQLFNDIPVRGQMVIFANDYISNEILSFGVYEKPQLDLIFEWLKKEKDIFNSTVLDIGANIGNHSLYFSSYFSKCISFEPNPRTFSVLEINSKLATNIFPMNIGLSDKKGGASLYTNLQNVGASSLSDGWNKSIDSSCEIQLDRADDVIDEGEKIGLIKMDVEGHEWFALKGAEKIIKNNKPIIIFEYNASENSGNNDVLGLLEEYGYDDYYEVVDGEEYLRQYLKRYPKFVRFIFKWLYILRRKRVPHRVIRIDEFTKQQYLIIIATAN